MAARCRPSRASSRRRDRRARQVRRFSPLVSSSARRFRSRAGRPDHRRDAHERPRQVASRLVERALDPLADVCRVKRPAVAGEQVLDVGVLAQRAGRESGAAAGCTAIPVSATASAFVRPDRLGDDQALVLGPPESDLAPHPIVDHRERRERACRAARSAAGGAARSSESAIAALSRLWRSSS